MNGYAALSYLIRHFCASRSAIRRDACASICSLLSQPALITAFDYNPIQEGIIKSRVWKMNDEVLMGMGGYWRWWWMWLLSGGFYALKLIMKQQHRIGFSFEDDALAFRGAFHNNRIPQAARPQPKKDVTRNTIFARFEKGIERKIAHARKRIIEKDEKKKQELLDKHEYQYKQFSDQPEIDFSPVSLLLLGPILLCVNLSIAQHEQIKSVQLVFFAMFITFMYNLVFIIRKNRIMPFLPIKPQDDRLKIIAILTSVGVYLCLEFGWNASGGMIFAIIWESLAGRQGCFYLIIFGAIVGGSITMEWTSPAFALRLAPSIIFGIVASLLRGLPTNNSYVICNQVSLFLLTTSAWLYPFMEVSPLNPWQYLVLLFLGFSCYFNMLLIIKLMQTQSTSIAMGVTTGILIISTTDFVSVTNYIACLTIILSILVLIKIEYLDKR